ncbi:PEPxxWA-CTERM sorting domain-containing protein [Kordiimonas sp. SCSIO 12610]|uniref:PEPxxWA-CTERM sorting domain-containing protein n=1 Tax=Kordiimonas sp. SCSIO 12610 TaxID=2829597 RepID=UPI002109C6C3|nr:PEPxxWA-CTERM sorting domain-containing protein [Kordiimonas sp. SCSIO 12610]UTW56234.1 PEP-CTERM sorting domain-containing protein [Kordiimonas sp. SCSIO 12610]
MKKLILTLFAVLLFGRMVNAQAQTFTFEGDITFQTAGLAQAAGFSSLTGRFDGEITIDIIGSATSSSIDSFGDAVARYEYTSFSLNIGALSASYSGNASQNNVFDIIDRNSTGRFDTDQLNILAFENLSVPELDFILIVLAFEQPITSLSGTDLGQLTRFVDQEPRQGSGTLATSQGGASFSNVTLSTPSAVPEPATWLMMIFGFAISGFALRRSQKRALVA